MIYLSSSSIKNNKISEIILLLVKNEVLNIELSGGTSYYPELEYDISNLKNKHELNLLCHNYFPPPQKPFVLNLASLNDEVYNNTIEYIKRSLELSKRLGAEKYAFHAGFFVEFGVNDLGTISGKHKTNNKNLAIERFCEGFNEIKKYASEVKLYIENNVFSYKNAKLYDFENNFMLTSKKDYLELKKMIDFNILLDVGHLKVSCKTLNLDFDSELDFFTDKTDYFHLSDNNGLEDENEIIDVESVFFTKLIKKIKDHTITLELNDKVETVVKNYEAVERIIND